MRHDVRKLTEGAMMIALLGIIMVIDRQIPGLAGTFPYIIPLPMVYYGARYGYRSSLVVYFAVVLLAFMLAAPGMIFVMAAWPLIGLIYGCGIYRQTESKRLFIRTILGGAAVELLMIAVMISFFGYTLQSMVDAEAKVMNEMLNLLAPGQPAPFDVNMLAKAITFAAPLFYGVLEGAITYYLGRMLLKRFRIPLPKSTPLLFYYPAKWTGYFGMLCLFLLVYGMNGKLGDGTFGVAAIGFGLLGTFYLLVFGVIAVLMIMPLLTRNKLLSSLFAFGLAMFLFFPMAILGFLYITTGIHQRILEGGYHHVSKDE